jgi:hypothetical protein
MCPVTARCRLQLSAPDPHPTPQADFRASLCESAKRKDLVDAVIEVGKDFTNLFPALKWGQVR